VTASCRPRMGGRVSSSATTSSSIAASWLTLRPGWRR
jgi:hypothetical protein